MNQTFDEFCETLKRDVTDGIIGYMQLFFDACQEIKRGTAEGPNATPDDGQDFPHEEYIRRTEEVLSRLRDAIWQLGALSPIAQYTGQSKEETLDGAEQEKTEEAKDRFLYSQLKADHYSNWLEVASSDKATRGHLEEAARLCAGIKNSDRYRNEIATAIATNPAADDEALLPLCDANYYSVWLITARSIYAGEKTLTRLAQECVGINNSDRYREEIAKALTSHASASDKTLLPLCESGYYTVWLIVAESDHAGEKTLRKLACQCAGINNSDRYAEKIARALANNPNSTDDTLLPLCDDATYFSVWEITAKSQYADKKTLSRLATLCAKTSSNSSYVQRTAQALAYHPNCTVDILALMAGAHSEEVSHIAHEGMKNLA